MNLTRLRKLSLLVAERDAIDRKLASALGVSPLYIKTRGSNRGKRKANGKLTRQRQLQGKYMGSVRGLTATQKKAVSKIREEKGYIAAIKQAKGFRKEA